MLVIVPAVAANTPEANPPPIVMEDGTLRRPELLESATTAPPASAALDSPTVQFAVAPDARLAGAHERELMTGGWGADSDTWVVCETPL